jgi:hypothetical protein
MENFHINSFIFDEPYEYSGLKFYPVRLRDYLLFINAVDCLLIDKNSIPDASIISMSYMEYLLLSSNEENNNIEKLFALLSICLKIDFKEIKIIEGENKKLLLVLSETKIDSDGFDNIKKIILEQNCVEIPDYTIQKEIRDKIEEGKRMSANNGTEMASFEDQIVSLSVASGIPMEKIYDMTYRKFLKSISRMDLLIHYKIYLQSSMSGMVTFKSTNFIKHWLTQTKDKNDNNGLLELNSVKDKMSFNDKK